MSDRGMAKKPLIVFSTATEPAEILGATPRELIRTRLPGGVDAADGGRVVRWHGHA